MTVRSYLFAITILTALSAGLVVSAVYMFGATIEHFVNPDED